MLTLEKLLEATKQCNSSPRHLVAIHLNQESLDELHEHCDWVMSDMDSNSNNFFAGARVFVSEWIMVRKLAMVFSDGSVEVFDAGLDPVGVRV